MYSKNKVPPISNLSDVQLKLFDFVDFENPVCENSKFDLDYSVKRNENEVYEYNQGFCKHCYSRNVVKQGYNPKMIIDDNGEAYNIKVQRYECKKCGKFSQTEFKDDYAPYCNYSNKTVDKIPLIRELDLISLRILSLILNITNDIKLSYETIRKLLKKLNKTEYKDEEMELSGFYGYDVQWVGTDDSTNKWSYRHVLFDLINNEPVAEKITSDESSDTTYDFINKNTDRRERIAIVTDLKPGYEKIMRKLGFEHQYCTFHLQLNIKGEIKQYFRTKEQKHKSKIKKEHPTWSKFKIKKETKKHFKEERHEINNYLKFFMKLFDCETYKEALEYIELIKQELNNFPPVLKEYLTKNFLPEYKKYIVFLKDEFKGKLDRTNNKTENYIGNTLPKAHKNKFRTNQGLFDHIYLRSIRWKKNQRNQLTN